MSEPSSKPDSQPSNEPSFLEASKTQKTGLVADFMSFLGENKKWWLIPFLIVFSLVAVVVVVGALVPGAAPFIYALF